MQSITGKAIWQGGSDISQKSGNQHDYHEKKKNPNHPIRPALQGITPPKQDREPHHERSVFCHYVVALVTEPSENDRITIPAMPMPSWFFEMSHAHVGGIRAAVNDSIHSYKPGCFFKLLYWNIGKL